jgi:hypothetical protein
MSVTYHEMIGAFEQNTSSMWDEFYTKASIPDRESVSICSSDVLRAKNKKGIVDEQELQSQVLHFDYKTFGKKNIVIPISVSSFDYLTLCESATKNHLEVLENFIHILEYKTQGFLWSEVKISFAFVSGGRKKITRLNGIDRQIGFILVSQIISGDYRDAECENVIEIDGKVRSKLLTELQINDFEEL